MPPRITTKGKVARPKKAAGRPKRGTAKKASAKLTYEDMQVFIQKMKKWWAELDVDVKGLEELIQKLPLDKPLSAEAERKLENLWKKIKKDAGRTECEPVPDFP